MKTINISELIKITQPGDILMIAGKGLFSKGIKIFQELQGDVAFYTHIAMFPENLIRNIDGVYVYAYFSTTKGGYAPYIIEANKTLDYKPLSQYINHNICVIRHSEMTLEKYQAAFYEIANNIGESYPYYRIVLHAIDNIFNRIFRMFHVKPLMKMSKWIKHDRPVCSEWIAQLYVAAKLLDEWAGINPDDFDDWRLKHPDKWLTIFEGKLIG